MRQQYAVVVAALAGLLHVAGGAWAFFAPRSFYDAVATFPPYNLHFMHDIGAFQLGIGAALLAALKWRDALLVVLLGATVGAGFHFVSHVLDRHMGGAASDPWLLGLLALVLAAGLVARFPARNGDSVLAQRERVRS